MTTDFAHFVPELRVDFVRRDLDGQCIVWSPIAAAPFVLDPVATVLLDVVDGEASVAELAAEVGEEIGVPLDAAQRQVQRVVELFAGAGVLTASESDTTAEEAISRQEIFASTGSTPCTENEARLGTSTLHLQLSGYTVRVACDARRAVRTLRDALAEYVVDGAEGDPLGFVLTAPQGLQRRHRLIDRAGVVLSRSRGLDTGLHALASHLTAFLPPSPGTVRFRARAVVAGDQTVLCLFPLLSYPDVDERDLARAGVDMVDRLAVDVDVRTGQLVTPDVPWPALAACRRGAGHIGTGGSRQVTTVVDIAPPLALPPRERVHMVAALAANGTHGTPGELLDAAIMLVQGTELLTVPPATERLTELLTDLGRRSSREAGVETPASISPK